ncbi:MAG: META domain-containing protein [Acidobacteriota bacterium]
MAWLQRPLLLVLLLSVLGCAPESDEPTATTAEAATPAPLEGTRWRLVQFQSMDDEVGTVAPSDPTQFTMSLRTDGTVAMQLDCNRGTGTWSSEVADDGASGSFTFGPLATTRALCPPPNLDERIARDAESVRSFLLRDGQLHLILLADGGIYSWEPDDSISAVEQPDAAVEDALRAAEAEIGEEIVGEGPESRYAFARFDLNDDGNEEVVAYLLGPYFCGSGGCTLHLLTRDGETYRSLGRFPLSRLPLIVSAEATDGWRDVYRPESGGGAASSFVRHRFDGTSYTAAVRLSGESPPEGRRVLGGEVAFDSAHPLAPSGP